MFTLDEEPNDEVEEISIEIMMAVERIIQGLMEDVERMVFILNVPDDKD